MQVLRLSAAGHRHRASHGAVSAAGANRQSLERVDEHRRAVPGRTCGVHQAVPQGGADAADAAPVAIRRRGLQCAASRFVRRARLSAADDDLALGAGEGFHRRRVRVDRATATDAIAGRGGAAPSGRRRGLRGARSSGARDAWHLSRHAEARGEPAAIRPSPHRGRDLSRREMIRDLFEEDVRGGRLAPGAMLLGGFARRFEAPCVPALRWVVEVAPFRHMVTPGGYRMSVAMTNCGAAGWVTDRTGYRYDSHDPQTGRPWPAMPDVFADLAAQAAARAGFDGFAPDACLINRYEPGARLSLHQDKNERDFSAPIVSASLGLPAVFPVGGLRRARTPRRVPLAHGDVVVWGGPARLRYHGVLPLEAGHHLLIGGHPINPTVRRAG